MGQVCFEIDAVSKARNKLCPKSKPALDKARAGPKFRLFQEHKAPASFQKRPFKKGLMHGGRFFLCAVPGKTAELPFQPKMGRAGAFRPLFKNFLGPLCCVASGSKPKSLQQGVSPFVPCPCFFASAQWPSFLSCCLSCASLPVRSTAIAIVNRRIRAVYQRNTGQKFCPNPANCFLSPPWLTKPPRR